jgi:hypothetical protein
MQTRGWTLLTLLLGFAVTVAACDAVGTLKEEQTDENADGPGGSADSAAVVSHYTGWNWDVKLKDDDTFIVAYADSLDDGTQQTVWGSYDRLDSGFLSMTVDSADGTDTPSAGEQAYALDIPGLAFVLHPQSEDSDKGSDELHVMVAAGECPTGPMDGNWVMMKDTEQVPANDPKAPFFGTFDFDLSNQYADLPTLYALAEFNLAGETEPTQEATCTNGIVDAPNTDLYVTASGLMAARLETSEEHRKYIFGVPNERTEGLGALDGEYAGLVYNNHDDPGHKVMPVHVACEGGTCTGAEVAEIKTGDEASNEPAKISFNAVNSPELGMVTGTITTSSTEESTDKTSAPSHIACAASTKGLDTDRTILSCVGMTPDNPERMFSVLLTSIDG